MTNQHTSKGDRIMNPVTGKRMGDGAWWILSVGLAVLVAGCGPSKMAKDQLEKARQAYAQAKADPNVKTLAPIHLSDAEKAVQEAEQSGNTTDMLHYSYVAEKKARIAMVVAEGKMADGETQRLNEETAKAIERKKELDRQRELEKKKAEEEAEKARQAAAAEAERAAMAKAETEKARLGAASEAERAAKAKAEAEQARLAAAAETEKAEKARREAEQARLNAAAEAEKAARAKAEADMLMQELSDLKAKQTERGIVLTIGDVLFAFGKADLSPKADRSVEKLAAFLTKYPNRNVLIEGHTDSIGSDDYNLGLSRLRAESVKTKLVGDGVEVPRITTVGYGKKHPAYPNDTDANRAQNRRVEVIILNEGVKAESQMRQ
ncbi:MAG TPA: flagellar motor protein MotB [Deltaproteobacteria bacterium]|nr:flagellar motor protein MotB [Deltaproteobacteria bacterium]